MSRDELAVLEGSKCILQLRGVRPFLSDKYDLTQHPNFKYTADSDKKLTFDIEKFLDTRAKLMISPQVHQTIFGIRARRKLLWHFSTAQSLYCRLS